MSAKRLFVISINGNPTDEFFGEGEKPKAKERRNALQEDGKSGARISRGPDHRHGPSRRASN